MAFVTPANIFLDGHLAGVLAQLFDIGESPVDLLLSAMRFRHEARDRPAVARDDDRFAPFDIVGLNFARHCGVD